MYIHEMMIDGTTVTNKPWWRWWLWWWLLWPPYV